MNFMKSAAWGLVIVIAAGGAVYVLAPGRAAKTPASPPGMSPEAKPPPDSMTGDQPLASPAPIASAERPVVRAPEPEPVNVAPPGTPEAAPAEPSNKPPAKAKKPKRELKDPFAREALALAGASPGADAYWLAAINNKDLPAEERADLIEDLNEEGLPDRPGPEDLPLIASRLRLIAAHAPYAMDKTNSEAFQEAFKDLSNMYMRLTQ